MGTGEGNSVKESCQKGWRGGERVKSESGAELRGAA